MANDALVICTKDRPVDLSDCLESLATCTDLPELILVVDSSSQPDSQVRCIDFEGRIRDSGSTLRYIHTGPGLTYQRNQGLAALPDHIEYVCFVDDDCLVPDGYFSTIRDTFSKNPGCVGACVVFRAPGIDYATPSAANPSSPWRRLPVRLFESTFALDRKPGRVNAAAVVGTLQRAPKVATEVEWVSGGSMAFHLTAARSTLFDDQGLYGYALGEDLEFSLRVSELGSLFVAPNVVMTHKASATNRLDRRRFARMDTVNRHYFVAQFPERFSRLAYWRSILGLLLKGVLQADRESISGTVEGVKELFAHSRQG